MSTVHVGSEPDGGITLAGVRQLANTLHELDRDPATSAIVIVGHPEVFCGEISRPAATTSAPRVDQEVADLIQTVLDLEAPLIASVSGSALDFGLSIVLLCDLAVVATEADFGDRSVAEGRVASVGNAMMLPLLLGSSRAKDLLLTGRTVSGTEAQALGLVHRAVPRAHLASQTDELARQLASQPRYAASATKMTINRHLRWMATQVVDTGLAYGALARSQSTSEGY